VDVGVELVLGSLGGGLGLGGVDVGVELVAVAGEVVRGNAEAVLEPPQKVHLEVVQLERGGVSDLLSPPPSTERSPLQGPLSWGSK
jgi:hypothetical protein